MLHDGIHCFLQALMGCFKEPQELFRMGCPGFPGLVEIESVVDAGGDPGGIQCQAQADRVPRCLTISSLVVPDRKDKALASPPVRLVCVQAHRELRN